MSDVQSYSEDFGWQPDPPEPFWERRWFRWRSACYECKTTFKTRFLHDVHWFETHGPGSDSDRPSSGGAI